MTDTPQGDKPQGEAERIVIDMTDTIVKQNHEIRRLKRLIREAYDAGKYAGHHYTGEEEKRYWKQFKLANNL